MRGISDKNNLVHPDAGKRLDECRDEPWLVKPALRTAFRVFRNYGPPELIHVMAHDYREAFHDIICELQDQEGVEKVIWVCEEKEVVVFQHEPGLIRERVRIYTVLCPYCRHVNVLRASQLPEGIGAMWSWGLPCEVCEQLIDERAVKDGRTNIETHREDGIYWYAAEYRGGLK